MLQQTTETTGPRELRLRIQQLERENARLERELQRAREIADSERLRAALADDSAKRAWSIAGWGGRRQPEDRPSQAI